jgi:hypothetical protein
VEILLDGRSGLTPMKQNLREFLRERCGMSDDELDKLERADSPTGGRTLRKGDTGDDSTRFHSSFSNVRKCYELIDEINASINRILKADACRGSVVRGQELFDAGVMNGVEHAMMEKGT